MGPPGRARAAATEPASSAGAGGEEEGREPGSATVPAECRNQHKMGNERPARKLRARHLGNRNLGNRNPRRTDFGKQPSLAFVSFDQFSQVGAEFLSSIGPFVQGAQLAKLFRGLTVVKRIFLGDQLV